MANLGSFVASFDSQDVFADKVPEALVCVLESFNTRAESDLSSPLASIMETSLFEEDTVFRLQSFYDECINDLRVEGNIRAQLGTLHDQYQVLTKDLRQPHIAGEVEGERISTVSRKRRWQDDLDSGDGDGDIEMADVDDPVAIPEGPNLAKRRRIAWPSASRSRPRP